MPTVIWCCCVRNLETEEEITFFNKEVFNAWLKSGYDADGSDRTFIGHNILSFDVPILNHLWDADIDLSGCIDSLVLSYLYNPAIDGGHSLEAWGERLKYPKDDYSDWSQLTPEMIEYCRQDVRLTLRVYEALKTKMLKLGYSELSCKIEHDIKVIIEEQISNGCYFDEARAKEFRDFLFRRQADLSESITGLFPKRREKVAEYTFRRRKDGSPTASYDHHRSKYSDIVHVLKDGVECYECYELVPFNLGSPQQRLQRLLELGWEPVSFTPKGNPKVDEDALLAFAEASGRQEVKALAEWLVVTARLSMLAGNIKTGSLGWLGYSRNGRIHGKVFSCGAASRRMTHNSPNTANPPSVKKAKYGREMRSLWGVEPGRGLCMVGYDAKGLETECFKHWLNSPAANKILDGDIHSDNLETLNKICQRELNRELHSKQSWYAWMFGCYPPKLMAILKCTKDQAEEIWGEVFPNRIPGLKKFIKEIQYEWKSNKGRLGCIDGGMVVCPSQSSALNYKIQPTGAVVMKLSSILIRQTTKEKGVWNRKLLDVHDEGQHEALEKDMYLDGETTRHPFGDIAVSCITRAGVDLGFNVPLTGSYSVGMDWSTTH